MKSGRLSLTRQTGWTYIMQLLATQTWMQCELQFTGSEEACNQRVSQLVAAPFFKTTSRQILCSLLAQFLATCLALCVARGCFTPWV